MQIFLNMIIVVVSSTVDILFLFYKIIKYLNKIARREPWLLSEASQIKLIGASATNHQRKKNKQINRTKIIIIGLYKPQ